MSENPNQNQNQKQKPGATAPAMPRRATREAKRAAAAQPAMPKPQDGATAADPAPSAIAGRTRKRSFAQANYRIPRIPPRPGYYRYGFNDTAGRIADAKDAGYEFVKDHDGKPISYRAGVAPTGGPLLAYVMEIPVEWHEEDRKAQAERENEMEMAIKGGLKQSGNADDANRYVAEHLGGANIRHAARR